MNTHRNSININFMMRSRGNISGSSSSGRWLCCSLVYNQNEESRGIEGDRTSIKASFPCSGSEWSDSVTESSTTWPGPPPQPGAILVKMSASSSDSGSVAESVSAERLACKEFDCSSSVLLVCLMSIAGSP